MMDVTNGRTALHYAVSGGKVQCARLLLCDHIASVPVKLGKQRMDGGYTVQVCEDAKWANSPGRSVPQPPHPAAPLPLPGTTQGRALGQAGWLTSIGRASA